MPKSASFQVPSVVNSTLLGFRSRWTTLRACAWASAARICCTTGTSSSQELGKRMRER